MNSYSFSTDEHELARFRTGSAAKNHIEPRFLGGIRIFDLTPAPPFWGKCISAWKFRLFRASAHGGANHDDVLFAEFSRTSDMVGTNHINRNVW